MGSVVDNRIFINQIPQTATKEDLSAHFSQFGLAVDVYMPLVYGTGQHKGMGFVTYENGESVQLALAHPGHIIHGTQVLVEVCLSKDKGTGKGTLNAIGKPLPGFENYGDRLFITKIPPEATREEVEAFFSQFGAWTDLYLPAGHFPAGHKGICFISYESQTSLRMAMQAAPRAILRGQQLILDVAAPRDPGKGGSKGAAPAPVFGGCGQAWGPPQQTAWVPPVAPVAAPLVTSMPVVPGLPTMPPYQQPMRTPAYATAPAQYVQTTVAATAPGVPGGGQQVPGRLFLTKVAQDVTKNDLIAYFQQFGELSDVFVPSGGKFIAFVSFAESSVAQVVVQSSQHEVKSGRIVNCDLAYDRPGKSVEAKGKGKFARFQPY